MSEWYANVSKGIAGEVADLTLSRVESFVAGGNIKAGSMLKLTSDKKKVVKLNEATDKAEFCGVALKSNKEIYADGYTYHEGDSVPVITFGDVYMTVEAEAKRGYVFTVADGTETLELTPVAVGTEGAFDKLEAVENAPASDVVAVRVKL